MGFVRRGGGGGGGGDEGGGDEEQGLAIERCEICRRELLPWEDTCPDDGGRAIAPGQVQPEHDALLARLLADEDDQGDAHGETSDDGPAAQWPQGGDAGEGGS